MENAQDEPRKKLNLKNVTDVIGKSFLNWRPGDFVIIESQTGTGKTYFVEMTLIKHFTADRILYVCNRKNLERQIKRDVLKIKERKIPDTIDELDKLPTIDNVTITTYQAIQSHILDDEYYEESFVKNYHYYKYIILDECHYILSDSSFNNTTRLVFNEFIRLIDMGPIKIFMSATPHEIKDPLINYIEQVSPKTIQSKFAQRLGLPTKFEPHIYSSGIDYSYLKPKYIRGRKTDIIAALIKNDTTDDKWIVFVSSKERQAEPLLSELGEDVVFITKDTEDTDPELNSIITNRCFSKKVLITTKVLDNGVNIVDESVKHIVIMTWDKITFIQMLGRRRVNIENADTVNLYIPMTDIRSFRTLLGVYKNKLEAVNLCRNSDDSNDKDEFGRKFNNDIKALSEFEEVIYFDKRTTSWAVNPIGEWRVQTDIKFIEYMIQKFKDEGSFAYIKEQLSWIGLEHTFNSNNLIESVIPNTKAERLEEYLYKLYKNRKAMLMAEDREELIEMIDSRNSDKKLLKRIGPLNSFLEEAGSQYRIVAYETSKIMEDGNKKNYKNAWRVDKLDV